MQNNKKDILEYFNKSSITQAINNKVDSDGGFKHNMAKPLYAGYVMAHEHQKSVISHLRGILAEKLTTNEYHEISNNVDNDGMGEYSLEKKHNDLRNLFYHMIENKKLSKIANTANDKEIQERFKDRLQGVLYLDKNEYFSENLFEMLSGQSDIIDRDKLINGLSPKILELMQLLREVDLMDGNDKDKSTKLLKKVAGLLSENESKSKSKGEDVKSVTELLNDRFSKEGSKFYNGQDDKELIKDLELSQAVKARGMRVVEEFGGLRKILSLMQENEKSEFITSESGKTLSKSEIGLTLQELKDHGLQNPLKLSQTDMLDMLKTIREGIENIPPEVREEMLDSSFKALIRVEDADTKNIYDYSESDLKFMLKELYSFEAENVLAV